MDLKIEVRLRYWVRLIKSSAHTCTLYYHVSHNLVPRASSFLVSSRVECRLKEQNWFANRKPCCINQHRTYSTIWKSSRHWAHSFVVNNSHAEESVSVYCIWKAQTQLSSNTRNSTRLLTQKYRLSRFFAALGRIITTNIVKNLGLYSACETITVSLQSFRSNKS